MKTILLTGSDGFIGSHIAQDLLDNGYKVIGIDNHSKYLQPCLDHYKHSNFRGYELDLISQISDVVSLITHEIGHIDTIIHAAARIGGIKMFHDEPCDIILNNAQIDTNILLLARRFKINKFIGLSSSMVYENTTSYPSVESDADIIAPPTSSYGFSKLTMERMIKAAHDQYGLNYNIVRPFNAIAVGENDFLEGKTSHVLPDLIVKCLQSKKSLEILGNGDQIRHFTHARDIARGIRYVLERADNAETYNISSPVSTHIVDLARIVWEKINPDQQFNYVCLDGFKYDIQKRIPDITKAYQQLGFQTEISLEQGVDEVVKYIKDRLK